MKKFILTIAAVITAALFLSCVADIKVKDEQPEEKGTVTLGLKNASERTISPADGVSYKDVATWTVTFLDATGTYDSISETVSFSDGGAAKVRLPLGSYTLTLEGTVSTDTDNIPYYGEGSVTLSESKPTDSLSILVSPKKQGTGSFNYELTLNGLENTPLDLLVATLEPVSSGTKKQELAVTQSETDENLYTLSASDIPSGFYNLSVKVTYTYGGKTVSDREIFMNRFDSYVEIIDGLETDGSKEITVSPETSKSYYATMDETQGNGAFASYPMNFDDVLKKEQNSTTDTVKIIMTDGKVPQINLSSLAESTKTYTIFDRTNTLLYAVDTSDGADPTVTFCNEELSLTGVEQDALKAVIVNGSSDVASVPTLSLTLEGNTSVSIADGAVRSIVPSNSTFSTYYASQPFVEITGVSANGSSVTVEFGSDSPRTDYSIMKKTDTENTTVSYFIVPNEDASLGVEGLPEYSVAATLNGAAVTEGTLLYAGDTVTLTATPTDGGAFADGTTFSWFVNGEKQAGETDTLDITFGQGDTNVENTVLCVASYKEGCASKTLTLYAQEQTVMLYSTRGNYVGYAPKSTLSEDTTVQEILNSATVSLLYDCCIDAKTNDIYAVYLDDSSLLKVAKYKYDKTAGSISDMYVNFEDYTVQNLDNLGSDFRIKPGLDEKLYLSYFLNGNYT